MVNVRIDDIPVHWLEEIINLSAEKIVVTDRDGIILYINESYCNFLGTTVEQAMRRPVQEVIENTRMHIVSRTGQAEIAAVHHINGSEMIANRFPLIVSGELVGAVGTVMFKNPEELHSYKGKIHHLVEELKYYKTKLEKELTSKYSFSDLIGTSRAFMEAKTLAERTSGSKSAVLLLGESGTGKELFAHSIHSCSLRNGFPFVAINCASIPEHLLESELFGYEDGAFTGAKRGGKKGQFQLANRGTIFLDEIGDMPLAMQSKLLRVLQEKEVHPVGSQKCVKVDVRIIAATHRDLEQMVEEGTFRQDLYYRLNVIKIEIPPLRNRKEDIKLLAEKLVEKLEKKFHRKFTDLSPEVVAILEKHSWPGNIRELENVMERCINVLDGDTIKIHHLPLYLRDQEISAGKQAIETKSNSVESVRPLKEIIAEAEKQAIMNALAAADGNRQEAAKLLNIGKTSFYEKCRIYSIK
ncbi:PAS domain-containing protein [Neobacillus notoginsengisoli]|uniref:PAS domain-containing protein n=1 Tax=Neobacillus notoginsengisoli TaxID=1578198 RepID=A0A417YW99_9BACI|nr:sigma 54-interacting transcriptional regulator [Neobacillus notoginsengisoli]RHW41689.1 PAS domain-containing protein [Neobacillus notoginsengisoli]